jgi:DNA-binding response OmpR family regulator
MRKRLLIVDDDFQVRQSLHCVLEDAGYEVICASDGNDAGNKLDDPKIELLVLDLNMPNGDGWDVLDEVQARHPLLPVIVITGMTEQLATLNLGAVFMTKPLNVLKLLHNVKKLLAETTEERIRRVNFGSETELWVRILGTEGDPAMKTVVRNCEDSR